MLFTEILNRNADFQRLYHGGAFCSLGSALLYAMPNRLPCNRLGITAGKKVGNAVHRNRAKRIIRAAYAAAEKDMPIGVDIVIVARSSLPEQSSDVLTQALCTKGVKHLHDVCSGKIPCQSGKPRTGRPAVRRPRPAKPAD